mgnify:CR=1 FL=1
MNELKVSTGRVRSAAAELKAAAEDLTEAAKAFQAEVSGFGAPWGGDEIGMLIGAAHNAIFQAAMECFTENAKELSEHAEGLRRVAKTHDQAESANVLYVNRVREFL